VNVQADGLSWIVRIWIPAFGSAHEAMKLCSLIQHGAPKSLRKTCFKRKGNCPFIHARLLSELESNAYVLF
jgi:hypothetical protein